MSGLDQDREFGSCEDTLARFPKSVPLMHGRRESHRRRILADQALQYGGGVLLIETLSQGGAKGEQGLSLRRVAERPGEAPDSRAKPQDIPHAAIASELVERLLDVPLALD